MLDCLEWNEKRNEISEKTHLKYSSNLIALFPNSFITTKHDIIGLYWHSVSVDGTTLSL